MDAVVSNLFEIAALLVGSAGLWYLFRFLVETCSSVAARASRVLTPRADDRSSHGFPVVMLEDDGGQYRVEGVLRETEEECVWAIEARTRANAIAKAEIRGMVVTQVDKVQAATMNPLDA